MGGVASAISNAVSSVGDAFESVGEVVEDVGKGVANAVSDAGTWIDKSVIQPIKENPIETAVMIAAVAYGGPLVAGYLGTSAAVGTAIATGTAAAGITASKGGDAEDILKAGAMGAAAGGAGGAVGSSVGGTYGATAGRIAAGATTGATGSAIAGRDVLQGAAIGAATAGIAEGVNIGVNAGYDYLSSTVGDFNMGGSGTKSYEFSFKDTGTPRPVAGMDYSEFGLRPTMPTGSTDYSFGIAPPISTPATPLYADYGNIQTEIGTKGISKEFGIDPNKEGGIGIKYDPDSGSTFGQLNPALPAGGLPSTYVLGSQTNPIKEEIKKTATKALTEEALSSVYGGGGTYDPSITFNLRRRSGAFNDELLDPNTESGVSLAAVQPDKFELRKYANPEGKSTLISFKDGQPQQPIPTGYEEVETVGAAKGGLIDSTKSETMVKYSKKPLVAARKPELTKKKKVTTRKGLAAKQS